MSETKIASEDDDELEEEEDSCCEARATTTATATMILPSMPGERICTCTRDNHAVPATVQQQQQQQQQNDRIAEPPEEEDCYHQRNRCGDHRYCCCGWFCCQRQQRLRQPSNTCLLATAFTTFLSFAICQMVFSVVAGSQALLGDSSAMFIDCVSYLLNWLAERRKGQLLLNRKQKQRNNNNPEQNEPAAAKKKDEERDQEQGIPMENELGTIDTATAISDSSNQRDEERALRQAFLQLEIITPLFSISALVGITSWILHDAILTFLSPASPLPPSSSSSSSEQEKDIHRSSSTEPNLNVMIIFSSINLLLDILNMSCFARAKHLLGYKTTSGTHHHQHHHGQETNTATMATIAADHVAVVVEDDVVSNAKEDPNDHTCRHTANDSEQDDVDDGANLNMCAAYTHVFADTQRSLAVILAVIIAKVVQGVTPEMADATAAIVVSLLILLSLIPLMQGLWQTVVEWRILRAEERAEAVVRNSDVCVAIAAATGTHPQSMKEIGSV